MYVHCILYRDYWCKSLKKVLSSHAKQNLKLRIQVKYFAVAKFRRRNDKPKSSLYVLYVYNIRAY